MKKGTANSVAEHRPALRRRRFRHDDLTALDLFSGFGGFTQGVESAGFTTILAANHNRYKVEVHERNHPHVEHWVADLVDTERSDYHSARDLPAADLLVAGISCVNHSQANTQKAYKQGLSLFDLDDPDYDARVTRSEKDRATANCVLHYADTHHPRMIIVECTTELASWGPLIQGSKSIGDGTTYRWWLKQFQNLGYRHRELRLNSMFFGVPQSRDRLYIVFWDKALPAPDLDHCPLSWCDRCDDVVEAVWSWKTAVPPSGSVRYGRQYEYRCPRCRCAVMPPATPAVHAIDFTDLGTKIGDRKLKDFVVDGRTVRLPLAPATLARAQRCLAKFSEFPAVLMPAKADRGAERHPFQPTSTQTSRQETALLAAGGIMMAAGNTFERPGSNCRIRSFDQPLWAQTATTNGVGVLSSGVIPFRKNTTPTAHAESMPTVTADQIPGLLTAAGVIKNNGSIDEAKYRAHPVSAPLGTVTAGDAKSLLFSGWVEQNGSRGGVPSLQPGTVPIDTRLSGNNTSLVTAEWREVLADLDLYDCYFRMMFAHETGRGCGFDVTFGDHQGSFVVWGKPRAQVDGFGNAVSPPIGQWIGSRCYAVLHNDRRAA